MAVAGFRETVTGRDLVTAVVAGYEVAARVGMSVGAAHLLAGWHPTGTHGTMGAAAAAANLLQLPTSQAREALGIAGSQSAGLMAAQYESMVKRFHAGRAAQSGVWSAMLARRGFTGIRDIFARDYGTYLTAFSPSSDASMLTAGLGQVWETLKVGFKPYSTNGSCHTTIDCILQLRADNYLTTADVDHVDVDVSTATFKHVGWPYKPDSVTTAQMNLPFITAVVLTDGEAFINQFTPERINDPRLVELAGRVSVHPQPDIDAGGAETRHATRVRVTTVDGRVLSAERKHARGSQHHPLALSEIEEKFLQLATTALPLAQAEELGQCVRSLHEASDLTQLTLLLTGREEPSR
jgi:2-methylcitrate dehydratase PrpD